ncbi:hypothetical protein B0H11DRAFT_1918045 [Mycena galericulata]|nr:hypothetical protein B0H11DRAFT_1918045 [Mycena galericulata]
MNALSGRDTLLPLLDFRVSVREALEGDGIRKMGDGISFDVGREGGFKYDSGVAMGAKAYMFHWNFQARTKADQGFHDFRAWMWCSISSETGQGRQRLMGIEYTVYCIDGPGERD